MNGLVVSMYVCVFAERLNISFVTEEHNSGLPTAEESEAVRIAQEEHKQYLSVPRRLAFSTRALI